MTDREVVESFVAFLAAHSRVGLVVNDWPEDHKDGEIDAIAGDLAIEHTSVDTLKNQRRDSEWFRQVVGPLETTLPRPEFSLQVILGNDAVRTGQEWDTIRNA